MKNTLRRFMIAEDKLLQNKTLRYVSKSIIEHNVWHLNRRSASRAMFIGLFFAFMPIPLQMIPSAFFCIWARANLPISIALVWITNPLTMPPILYAAYKMGAFILQIPVIEFQLEWEWVTQNIPDMWKPLLLGCLILSTSFACLGYMGVDLLWRWSTLRKWEKRKHRHS